MNVNSFLTKSYNRMYNGYTPSQREQQSYQQPKAYKPTERTFVDEVFDLLQITQYTVMGAVDETIKEGNLFGAVKGAAKGFTQGLSILPGWEGYSEPADYSFSDVLGDTGWNPTSTGGKIAKGVVGLAGDIIFDPMTYASFGGSALLKGSGKVGKEVAEGSIKQLLELGATKAAKEVNESMITNGLKGLSKEASQEIVSKYAAKHGKTLTKEGLEKASDDFVKKYNSLLNQNRLGNKGMSIGVENMPFADKLVSDPSKYTFEFLSKESVEKIGDKTLAPVVDGIIETFYKSPLGKKFSTKTGLRELAKSDPEALYDTMQFLKELGANNETRVKQLQLLKKFVDERGLKELTPEKQRQMIKVLQGKEILHYINVQTGEKFANAKQAYKKYVNDMRPSAEKQMDIKDAADGIKVKRAPEVEEAREMFKDSKTFNTNIMDDDYVVDLSRKSKRLDDSIKSFDESLELIGNIETPKDMRAYFNSTEEGMVAKKVLQRQGVTVDDKFIESLYDRNQMIKKQMFGDIKELVNSSYPDKYNMINVDHVSDKVLSALVEKYNKDGIDGVHELIRTNKFINLSTSGIYEYANKFGAQAQGVTKNSDIYRSALNRMRKTFDGDIVSKSGKKVSSINVPEETLDKIDLILGTRKEVRAKRQSVKDVVIPDRRLDDLKADFLVAKDDATREKLAKQIAELRGQKKSKGNVQSAGRDVAGEFEQVGEAYRTNPKDITKGQFDQIVEILENDLGKEKATELLSPYTKNLSKIAESRNQWIKRHEKVFMSRDKEIRNALEERLYIKEASESKYSKLQQQAIDEIESAQDAANAVENQISFDKKSLDDIYKEVDRVGDRQLISDFKDLKDNESVIESQLKNLREKYASEIDGDSLDIETIRSFPEYKALENDLAKTKEEIQNTWNEYQKSINRDLGIKNPESFKKIDNERKFIDEIKDKTVEKQIFDDVSEKDIQAVKDAQKAIEVEEIQDVLSFDEFVEQKLRTNLKGMSTKDADTVLEVRKQFIEAGDKEVMAGLLDEAQYKKWFGNYFPGILTKKGKAKLDEFYGIEKTIKNYVTDLFGFKQTNKESFAFQKSVDDIVAFNEKFRGEHNVDAFMEDIGNVYVARMMAHNDAFYQRGFAKKVIKDLGQNSFDDAGKFVAPAENFKTVIAYGDLMDNVTLTARRRAKEMVSRNAGMDFQVSYAEEIKSAMREMSAKYGIDLEDASSWGKPVVELNEKQAQMIAQDLGVESRIKNVHYAQMDTFNHARDVEIARKSNQILNAYDKFLQLWKLNVTAIIPGFHARNFVSNQFQNFLKIGSDITDVELQVAATKAIKSKGKYAGKILEDTRVPNPVDFVVDSKGGASVADDFIKVEEMTMADFYDEADRLGILNEGYFNSDFDEASSAWGSVKDLVQGDVEDAAKNAGDFIKGAGKNPLKSDFVLYELGREAGSFIETRDKLVHYVSLRRSGESAEAAADSVRKFLFDYNDLTVFEHTTMKRIFPFYTWMKKNTALQLEQSIMQPQLYRNLAKVLDAIDDDSEEGSNKPRWMDNYVKLPFDIGDKSAFLNTNLPIQDLNNIPSSMNPATTAVELLNKTSPMIKAPIELALGKNTHFNAPIDNPLEYLLNYFSAYSFSSQQMNPNKTTTDKTLNALSKGTGISIRRY